jgi:hypothetical protein
MIKQLSIRRITRTDGVLALEVEGLPLYCTLELIQNGVRYSVQHLCGTVVCTFPVGVSTLRVTLTGGSPLSLNLPAV